MDSKDMPLSLYGWRPSWIWPKKRVKGVEKFEPYDFLVIWSLMMQYPSLTQFGQTNLANSIFVTSQPPLKLSHCLFHLGLRPQFEFWISVSHRMNREKFGMYEIFIMESRVFPWSTFVKRRGSLMEYLRISITLVIDKKDTKINSVQVSSNISMLHISAN